MKEKQRSFRSRPARQMKVMQPNRLHVLIRLIYTRGRYLPSPLQFEFLLAVFEHEQVSAATFF